MINPYFSIIIPTYNRAGFIEKTINSVLNQTYTNFEVIVVDDGSTDNTKKLVTSIDDKRIKYYWKENAERGAARNFGIKKAKGDYITFLDSDDLLYPNHFSEASNLISKSLNNALFFHLGYEIIDENGNILKKINNRKSDININLIKGNFLSCIGVFIKRNILLEINFIEDKNFILSEDWLLWLKLSARYKLYYSNQITARLIQHTERSVNDFKEDIFFYCTDILIKELKKDTFFMAVYSKYISSIHAHMFSYTSLHAAIAKENLLALKYLWFATIKNPNEFFKRRTLAIFNLLFKNILSK